MQYVTFQQLIKQTKISEILDAYDKIYPVKNERCFIDCNFDTPKNRQSVKIKRRKQLIATMKEMLNIEAKINHDNMLIVIKLKDEADDSDKAIDIYDCFQSEKSTISEKQSDADRYAIDLCAWEIILGSDVCRESISQYGAGTVVATIIYEMTFVGWTKADTDKEIENLNKICEEIDEEIDDGKTEKGMSVEDFLKEVGYEDTRTEEEKETQKQKMLKNAQENQIIFINFLKNIEV